MFAVISLMDDGIIQIESQGSKTMAVFPSKKDAEDFALSHNVDCKIVEVTIRVS